MATAVPYSESPIWQDVIPIPQDDPPNALASIAYPDHYAEAMSYLRAVMAANEYSERVLDLTEGIVKDNSAHYTVWLYRAQTLLHLAQTDADQGKQRLEAEIEWLNPMALKHEKNYQIWQHRQVIINRLGSHEGESDFILRMLQNDGKNYHVWSYRQWLVKRFDLWDDQTEEDDWNRMIEIDVRNNSAWNHRWYLVFGRPDGEKRFEDAAVVEREAEIAKKAIALAPQNQSPWNYLRGLSRRSKAHLPLSSLEDFCLQFSDPQNPDTVRSSHALDVTSEIYAQTGDHKKAAEVLDLLSTRYDPIRANYWNYRKRQLNLT